MWRFYTRYSNTDLASMAPSDRANWSACHAVFTFVTKEWQDVIRLYYQRTELNAYTIHDYCKDHAMPISTVWHIIRAVQTAAAEERGLIEHRERLIEHRERKPDRVNSNATGPDEHRERKPYRATSAEDNATGNKTMPAEQNSTSAEQEE